MLKNDVVELTFYDDTGSIELEDDDSLMSFQFMLKLARDDSVKLKLKVGRIYTDSTRIRIFNGQFMRPL